MAAAPVQKSGKASGSHAAFYISMALLAVFALGVAYYLNMSQDNDNQVQSETSNAPLKHPPKDRAKPAAPAAEVKPEAKP